MTGNGYVIKRDGIAFPNALLAPDGYSNTPNRRQDKGSYTDGQGKTIRNILPIKRTTSKLKTIESLTYGQKLIVQSFFPNRDYVTLELWNDEINGYETATCYIPDVEYTIHHIDKHGNFYYNAVEIEFISYGGS
ncbi:DUF6711 family protein [Anaerocolumna chitinilytica]|uniref:Uncharacterized protein n=1 Tax=Anaerocolumna chitinilytica TaxID=1727145 RepID=A0A7M3SAH7_9FIRM|nr:DUF6711 family protein [Anaerocolumna chitinilytica]BCK01595.1 hypothetical protein bsdcttw_46350 [Anaerocolumna chitinilytica]